MVRSCETGGERQGSFELSDAVLASAGFVVGYAEIVVAQRDTGRQRARALEGVDR